MSEFEQVHELRRSLLIATYDEAGGIPNHPVMLWKVAERMEGLDTSDPDYVHNLSSAAQVLGAQGKLNRQTIDWGAFSLTADGIADVEGTRQEPQQNVSNVFVSGGNFYQSAIGTHNTNNFSGQFDFRSIEQRIEAEGGEDKEELHAIVNEMRELLERGGTVNKGFLARHNAKLQQYEWLANAVAGWLLNFVTQ